jgi:hypothetical protein
MKLRNVVRALITAGAATALCTLTVSAHAMTGGSGTRAAIVCPTGDLCLQPANSTAVLVRSGQRRSFNPPLQVVLIANHTHLSYCVEVGLINYIDIPPNRTISGTRTVHGVVPGSVCPG